MKNIFSINIGSVLSLSLFIVRNRLIAKEKVRFDVAIIIAFKIIRVFRAIIVLFVEIIIAANQKTHFAYKIDQLFYLGSFVLGIALS